MNCVTQADLAVEWVHPAEPVYREVDHQKTVVVTFELELEFRSWGLKDVTVAPQGVVTVPLFIHDYPNGQSDAAIERGVSVSLDLARCKVKYQPVGNGSCTITAVELRLTPEFEPDYRFCEIHVRR